jgi:F-type H+-transporting ATPase subunit delta
MRTVSAIQAGALSVAAEDAGVSGVSGRYATALFDLARDAGKVDVVAGDLASFGRALNESEDLTRLVRSPAIAAADQGNALGAVLTKMGADGLTRNFLLLVARNRRLFAVGDMLNAFAKLLQKHKNQVQAEVTSAQALDEGQLTELKRTLAESTGRDVQLSLKVDPSILGGLIVKVGSQMIDSSLRTRLNNLKFAMKEVR